MKIISGTTRRLAATMTLITLLPIYQFDFSEKSEISHFQTPYIDYWYERENYLYKITARTMSKRINLYCNEYKIPRIDTLSHFENFQNRFLS